MLVKDNSYLKFRGHMWYMLRIQYTPFILYIVMNVDGVINSLGSAMLLSGRVSTYTQTSHLQGSLLSPHTASYTEHWTSNAWTLRISNPCLTHSYWPSEVTCRAVLKLRRGGSLPKTPDFLIQSPSCVWLLPNLAKAPTDHTW